MQKDYQICTRCVMDTTDPDITFDKNGVCHHCHDYDLYIKYYTYPAEEGQKILKQIVQKIKNDGKGKDYDCLIGISGGVDSSFVSHKVVELGLRPLAVHLDNGWDSELAVSNIHKILNKLNIDLYTYVIDWEEFKDLQLAFLKASTPDSEIPSDHAIAAIMYQTADQMGIKYVIPGQNFRTESHAVPAWSRGHYDWKYIENVHKRYGKIPLKTYPHFTVEYLRKYQSKQLWVYLLDYINYNKQEAMNFLKEHYDWQYYGGKHYESVYTRFFQGYILPVKFGFDKRRMHLST
jgi:N-acetyl sugar amidotransferase